MRTELNRLATLAAMLRNGGDVIDVADELDAMAAETTGATLGAREGPSDGEMLEWIVDHAAQVQAVLGNLVAVEWRTGDRRNPSRNLTTAANPRNAIRKAMAEDAESGQGSEVNHG